MNSNSVRTLQHTLPYQKYSYTTKYPCSESTKYPVGSKDGH